MAILTGAARTSSVLDAPSAPLDDDDLQLALYLSYEVHYRGLEGVPDHAEWDPAHLTWRRRIEDIFEAELDRVVGRRPVAPDQVAPTLRGLDAASTLPLARYIEHQASLDQVREFVTHRSAYHLKEADPHSFAIPRLSGAAKAAFVQIQADEYGSGDAQRAHAHLFASMMTRLDLDPRYGVYLDRLPGWTLATVNLMSLFGLHRRWRGAAVGHLALFELGSPRPNRCYGNGLRRLGFGPETTDFHDEHVAADAVHSMIATYDLAARLAQDEPELASDIVFGAETLDHLDGIAGERMIDAWTRGESSLLPGSVSVAA